MSTPTPPHGAASDTAAPAPPLLRFEHVFKRFGGIGAVLRGRDGTPVDAVSDIDLTIEAGAAVGVIGPSGSGKSTLAKLARGLEAPSSGRVLVDGGPLRLRGRAARRDFAATAQLIDRLAMLDLDAQRTPAQLARDALDLHKVGPAKARAAVAERLLDEVGLELNLTEVPSRELADDLAQRVAIARALATNPRLLICDEAVGALDGPSRTRILALLNRLRDTRGVAILFISHNLALIRGFCEQVVVLSEGRIVEAGRTAAVFGAPQRPETKAMLAAADLAPAPPPG